MIFNEVVRDLGDPREERVHAIAYVRLAENGAVERGVALVPSRREAPSWRECRAVIPGYSTGRYLGLA